MDPSSLNSAFRRFVTFFTVKGYEGPGRNRWRNIGSLHPIYKGKINVPIIIKYTSRKKYGSKSFHVVTQIKKTKKMFLMKKTTTTRLECMLFVLRMSKPKFSHLNTAGITQRWGQGPP